jgi:hypothetical protein
MILRGRNSAWFTGIVSGAALLATLSSSAEIRDDVHIQSDGDAVRLDIDTRTYKDVLSFFEAGYPTASVILHAVSQGMSINDAVYLAVKANREAAEEIYSVATGLLPSLPGWVCHTSEWAAGRYPQDISVDELGPQPSILAVADRFFNNNERLVPFPEWQGGKAHMTAAVSELDALPRQEWWYRTPGSTMSDDEVLAQPLFISMYAGDSTVLADNNLGHIDIAKRRGITELPVVVVYNQPNVYPVGELGPDAKVSDVAQRFFSAGQEITPVPEWAVGQYHVMAKRDELEQLFELPRKEDVNPQRWAQIEEDLQQNGFKKKPMLLSLVDNNRMWADDTTRLAVAKELGIEDVPVVYFFHGMNRLACGQSATLCADQICNALVAGGGDPAACNAPPAAGAGTAPLAAPPPPPAGGTASPS